MCFAESDWGAIQKQTLATYQTPPLPQIVQQECLEAKKSIQGIHFGARIPVAATVLIIFRG